MLPKSAYYEDQMTNQKENVSIQPDTDIESEHQRGETITNKAGT